MNLQNKEILVVEDSVTQAEKMKRILEENKFIVRLVNNGEEALQALREKLPDLVISDVIMPKMDGFRLCRMIRKNRRWKDLPVILVTALSEPEDIISGLDCGANSFITKPYEAEFLVNQVEFVLVNHKMRKHSSPELGFEIYFAGKKQFITSDKLQIVDLLLSTFENAIQKNRELERTNDTLLQIQHELEVKNDELARLNEEKNQFLGIASHDLRSPLNVVSGYSELLLDGMVGELNSEQEEFVKHIKDSSDFMLDMVEKLLDITSIEAGKLSLNRSEVDLKEFLEQNISLNQVLASKKGIELSLKISGELPIYNLDRERFEQVLNNLINNAVKFSPPQSEISIVAERRASQVVLSVIDEGPGIPKEERESLFQPYEKSQTTKEKGTGLGLTIARKIVEEHGGKIWVDGSEGSGARFQVALPLDE